MNLLKELLEEIKLLFAGYGDWIKNIFQNNRTKIYSLIIFLVIILPGVIMPTFTQPVNEIYIPSIGATEKTANFNLPNVDLSFMTPKETYSIKPPQIYQTQIDSTLLAENTLNNIKKPIEQIQKSKTNFEGKISWDDTLSEGIATDRFMIDSNVKITFNGNPTTKRITQRRILSDDNILLVDKKTFAELGGDPTKDKTIIANISEE
jgi:hypothetical protein